ncbi:hypothetical protein ACFLQY_01355 [Verrucomicrobiota bacterium]
MKKVIWQSDHKIESLEAWVQELNEEARLQFLKAGTHVELLLVFADTGPTTMLPVYRISHDEAEGRLKDLVFKQHAYAVAHIVSCVVNMPLDLNDNIHMRVPDAKMDADKAGEGSVAEILVVHAHSRDHSNITFFNPVVRGKDRVMLMDSIRLDVPFEGRFEVDL